MKMNLWIAFFVLIALSGCLGEKTPTYDNPIDPGAENYQKFPARTLEETQGMVDDFENCDTTTLLGTSISNWGPLEKDAEGTIRSAEITEVGGSATTSPKGHLRMTTHFGTGSGNYSGVSLNLSDGKWNPLDLRGYQGLMFQLHGDPGPLKVTIGSPSILDFNDAATVVEMVPRDWVQVYIPFDDSLFGCNFKPGCPALSSYLHQVSGVSFNLQGWQRNTRTIDIDLVQLIAKGSAIPTSAKPLQAFRQVNVVESHADHFFFDFNEIPDDSVIVSVSSGARANFWSTIRTDAVSLGYAEEGGAVGSFRSVQMNYEFSTGTSASLISMAGLNLELDPSFAGRDISKIKGIRFLVKNNATGKVNFALRLWSDLVQKAQAKDYNAPEFVFTATKDWAKKEILFASQQVCAYRGTTDCPSYVDVLKQIQSLQFIVAIDQETAVTGALLLDDVEFIY